jgi:cytochrome c oxidase subunit II
MARAAMPLVADIVAAAAAFLLLSAGGGSPPPAASAPGEPTGRAVFARMGCGGCHTLAAASARGEIGPDLDARVPSHTAASLRAKILDPAATAPDDGAFVEMPRDFGERMSRAELDALVAYLLEVAGD